MAISDESVSKYIEGKRYYPKYVRKGNCLDNAVIENFFGTIKSKLFYTEKFGSTEELKKEIVKYIHYYNHDRVRLNESVSSSCETDSKTIVLHINPIAEKLVSTRAFFLFGLTGGI